MIYWWEWTHRLLARATGAVFLLPFLFFLWRGSIPPRLRGAAVDDLRRGAALGAVGWWMVRPGLRRPRQRVAIPAGVPPDARLRDLCRGAVDGASRSRRGRSTRRRAAALGALAIAALVLVQIYLGALVAGLDAGLIYNTWPLIDGAFMPDGATAVVHAPPGAICSRTR